MVAFRAIFLGERRISERALGLITSPRFRDAFELKVLVSNHQFHQGARRVLPAIGEVEFIPNAKRSSEEIEAAITRNHIDLLLSVQHVWILPPAILHAVHGLAFNLHNAALPDYKGYNSISHAIIDGAETFRSTIHWMAPEVDSGDIAFEGMIPIRARDTALSLYQRSVDAACDAFEKLLVALVQGNVPKRPMEKGGRFYGRHDLTALKDLTNVTDADRRERIIRAAYFPPYEPAYEVLNGAKVYLLPEATHREVLGRMRPENEPVWSRPR